MKVPNKLIKVSKASILGKIFDVDISKLTPDELEKAKAFFPTEEEKEFMTIFKSNAPQLVRLQRKMSVCLDVEVTELEEGKVSFEYGENVFTVLEPKNAFRICTALERGKAEAFFEVIAQGCVLKNNVVVEDQRIKSSLGVDELQALQLVTDKFFFLVSLAS